MQEINYNQELLNNAINNTYLITEEGLMFEGWDVDNYE